MRRDTKITADKYLQFVRSKPCVACHHQNVHAHHLVAVGQRESKRNDFLALPMCRTHHTEYHTVGPVIFAARYQVDLWKECLWLLIEHIMETNGQIETERGKV